MKRIWLTLLLLTTVLVLLDGLCSAKRWWDIDSCLERGLRFDYSRQACDDAASSALLRWWSENQTLVRSARTFALLSFFTVGIVMMRHNRTSS